MARITATLSFETTPSTVPDNIRLAQVAINLLDASLRIRGVEFKSDHRMYLTVERDTNPGFDGEVHDSEAAAIIILDDLTSCRMEADSVEVDSSLSVFDPETTEYVEPAFGEPDKF